MKGRKDIVLYSWTFVAGAVAGGLFCGVFPAAVFLILIVLITTAAVLLALTRQRPVAVAAFLMLGITAAAIGSGGENGRLKAKAADIKAQTSSSLADIAGGAESPEGAILGAIAIGDRSRVDRSLKSDFRSSGAMHLIALSGLHIGVLYFFLTLTLSFLGNGRPLRIVRKLLIIILLWAYALISGMSASIMRAVIMITVYEIGEIAGSSRDLERSLAISAFVTTIINPSAPFQIGFQLSYAAMAAICFIYPWLNSLLKCRSALMEKVWNTVALSISCQAATAPLVLLYFGTFPKYFMITNFVAIPLTSAAIYLTPFALITRNLPVVGDFSAAALHSALKLLRTVIHIIAGL